MAKHYHMLHNPLFKINFVLVFFKNCNSHSIHGIQHHLFFFQPCVALLHVLRGTSVLTSTVSSIPSVFSLYSKQCQWLFSAPAAICSYHTYEWASIQSFVSAQIPQSSAAVPAPVQSERLPLRQKSHSFLC